MQHHSVQLSLSRANFIWQHSIAFITKSNLRCFACSYVSGNGELLWRLQNVFVHKIVTLLSRKSLVTQWG